MAKLKNIAWWLCFIFVGVCAQTLAPGLDILVVGLIILLQEEDYASMCWLAPLFCLLQEGMGTRPFGTAIIWYGAVIAIFLLGRWLFEARNFIFVFLLSASLGCAYFFVAWLAAPLQNMAFNLPDTLDKALTQAIFMPFAWRMLLALRPTSAKSGDVEEKAV